VNTVVNKRSLVVVFALSAMTAILITALFGLPVVLAAATTDVLVTDPDVVKWGLVAAAAATGASALAAGYAVAVVASAAVGALTEKPELFGRVLVLVGLAEGIAIYGLIISILILNQLG
jgi:V/A-type H+-transporting ATPase subunit K